MNIALWIAQGLLAAIYLMAGAMKTFMTPRAKETWVHLCNCEYW